jgi:predicted ATP-dependent protease
VLIPQANVKDLMLRAEVREAVQNGQFHVYPIETVDQGMERLTGLEMGERQDDGTYPAGSINERVAHRLEQFAEERAEFQMSHDGQAQSVT